jgi:hypothetical protein
MTDQPPANAAARTAPYAHVGQRSRPAVPKCQLYWQGFPEEHGPRKADVPSYPMAGQAASPHGLIDPARLDVEIPSCLLWAKESILHKGGRCLCCCWCWSLHPPPTDPQVPGSASEFGATLSRRLDASVSPNWPAGTSRRSLRAPRAALQGNRWGNWPLAFCQVWCWQGCSSVLFARFVGVAGCALRGVFCER